MLRLGITASKLGAASPTGAKMTDQSPENTQFFITAPTSCPYLPGKEERKIFTHLSGKRATTMHAMLANNGFRRSQNVVYRPACESCQACLSCRVIASAFEPSKNLTRISKKNSDLIGQIVEPVATSEQYHLFRDYLSDRHDEGGMADMSYLDYECMVEDTLVDTVLIEYRARGADSGITGVGQGPLIAVSLCDLLPDGLSMVYSFFTTDYPKRSLGSFMILDHISRARGLGLEYVYLGYWVAASPKMAYKKRFLPQEHLYPNEGWVLFDASTDVQSL